MGWRAGPAYSPSAVCDPCDDPAALPDAPFDCTAADSNSLAGLVALTPPVVVERQLEPLLPVDPDQPRVLLASTLALKRAVLVVALRGDEAAAALALADNVESIFPGGGRECFVSQTLLATTDQSETRDEPVVERVGG